jgi:hypothetical protein
MSITQLLVDINYNIFKNDDKNTNLHCLINAIMDLCIQYKDKKDNKSLWFFKNYQNWDKYDYMSFLFSFVTAFWKPKLMETPTSKIESTQLESTINGMTVFHHIHTTSDNLLTLLKINIIQKTNEDVTHVMNLVNSCYPEPEIKDKLVKLEYSVYYLLLKSWTEYAITLTDETFVETISKLPAIVSFFRVMYFKKNK